MALTERTVSSRQYADVTPSDSTVFNPMPRAIYHGGTAPAAIVLEDEEGTEVSFTNVPPGTVLPVQFTKVKASSTAQNLVALY